jgi:hypothetical protein
MIIAILVAIMHLIQLILQLIYPSRTALAVFECITLGLMMCCEVPLMFRLVLNATLAGQAKMDSGDPQMTPNEYDHASIF